VNQSSVDIRTDEGIVEASLRDFFLLLKPRVMTLVVFTAFVGLILAPGGPHPLLAAVAVLCIAIGAGAAGAINMWYDRDIDAIMSRTSGRPIPAGRMDPDTALSFGLVLSFFSVLLMGLALNWLAAGLLAFASAFYVLVYTMWLKRRTPQNIVIGGAAGAFPPMIGWAAATGELGLEALVLFLIIFAWTPPHFWALSLYREGDYAKAGVPMLPVVAGLPSTRRHIFAYTVVLAAVSLAPWYLGFAGNLFGFAALALNARFLWLAGRILREGDKGPAGRTFGYSILYLFLIFAFLVIDQAFGAWFATLLSGATG
jgi:protoheme IX farnesyltransferase